MANSATTRPGLPADKYVLATRTLTPRGPAVAEAAAAPSLRGVRSTYRILRTDEVDAKDEPLSAAERNNVATTAVAAATRSTGDDFAGTARKAAKLSISDGRIESFADIP